MDISQEILSQFVIFTKYAKYLPELSRRETWMEVCDRYENMMIIKYPGLKDTIIRCVEDVRNKKVLPSMRAMQFAGPAVAKTESRMYNCAFLPIDHYKSFSETMFLLLGGTGVGYSVQKQHVAKLANIKKPSGSKRYVIGDSIEGWSDAIKTLLKAYLGHRKTQPRFDYSDIRVKGSRLVTAGGKAPGPAPLKECLEKIENLLKSKVDGDKLTSLNCHDILCYIANAVLSGGIRRAALLSLFSYDDEEMLNCKSGEWWKENEQRSRSNNSVTLLRSETSEEQFNSIWSIIKSSGCGEPGISWTNNLDWGFNPCHEISLNSYQFCNLCEVNVSDVDTQEELNERVKTAAILGTLQAGFTDFHYLRDIWKKTTEEDALIGVGMTGIASKKVLNLDLKEAANIVKEVNKDYAFILNINPAARTCTIKPSGTTSCVLGTSSGIHAWHNDYYIRRIRLGKNESIYTYLSIHHPELLEDDVFRPEIQSVLSIPQRAPKGSILRTETALDLLERTKKFNLEWVKEGHITGDNINNVSATISIDSNRFYNVGVSKKLYQDSYELVKEGDSLKHKIILDEWQMVGEWMWENREHYSGISVLPTDNGSYIQSPFENITEEQHVKLSENLSLIDLTKVVEFDDVTNFNEFAACGGGGCDVK